MKELFKPLLWQIGEFRWQNIHRSYERTANPNMLATNKLLVQEILQFWAWKKRKKLKPTPTCY